MTNQRELILREIDHLLEAFTEQYECCRNTEAPVSLIELDLMKQNIRNLYQQLNDLGKVQERKSFGENDHIVIERKEKSMVASAPIQKAVTDFNSYPEASVDIPADKSIAFADLLIAQEEENLISSKTLQNPVTNNYVHTETLVNITEAPAAEIREVIKEPVLNHVSEPLLDAEIKQEPVQAPLIEIPVAEVKEKITAPVIERPLFPEKKTVPNTASLFDQPVSSVKDKFKEQQSVYHQISKSHTDESLGSKLQKKQVEDLKKSIGINERFAFINELFGGSQQLFAESIDKLNNYNAYEDARRTLYEDLAGKMSWDTGSKVFSDLDELVKRRFGA